MHCKMLRHFEEINLLQAMPMEFLANHLTTVLALQRMDFS